MGTHSLLDTVGEIDHIIHCPSRAKRMNVTLNIFPLFEILAASSLWERRTPCYGNHSANRKALKIIELKRWLRLSRICDSRNGRFCKKSVKEVP